MPTKLIGSGKEVVRITWFQTPTKNARMRSVNILAMTPSEWCEDGGGYAPAESVQFVLYAEEIKELIDTLYKALSDQTPTLDNPED